MLTLNRNEFQYVRQLLWTEVFEIWRKTEARNPNWEAHYKERGFSTWEEWRRTYVEPLKCAEREWHLYKILDPVRSVPKFHGGPIRSWMEKYYGGQKRPRFSEIVQGSKIQQHGYVLQLRDNFPKETALTGLVTKERIVIIEGMHRCCAMALAVMEGRNIESEVCIALAKFEGRLPMLGGSGNKKGN